MFNIKLTILNILLFLFGCVSLSFGQSSINDTTVTLHCENEPLRIVLQEIEKQTHVRFVYHDALVDGKTVSCQFTKRSIQESLIQITQQSRLSFILQSDKRIVLFKRLSNKSTINMIQGRVIDSASKKSLTLANIFLSGTSMGASTDENGEFIIPNIPYGHYDLKCMYIGYGIKTIPNISISENTRLYYNISMDIKPIPMKEITVTPSYFAILGTTPTASQILTRRDIEKNPLFGNDIYRSVSRLPGVSMKDFSARFAVRGGKHNQVLVLMDGLELYEPYHLKYIFGGAISIIDASATESVELITGAFTADYGDRLSAVFKIESKKPPVNEKRFSFGISLMNARLISEGSFLKNRGSWLVSVRRGYLGLGFRKSGTKKERPSSFYYDILGKIQYRLNKYHNLFVNFLHANDRLVNVENSGGRINNSYGNTYAWLRLHSLLNPSLSINTIISAGQVNHNCSALGYNDGNQNLTYSVWDARDFHFYGLKQDWNLQLSDQHDLRWGLDLKQLAADYDYTSLSQHYSPIDSELKDRLDTTRVVIGPSGHEFGVYLSNRFRIFAPLTTEIGFRYDYASYTHDEIFSPRFNLVYTLGRRTFIRAGWGHFYQTQGIHEFYVQDGENAFSSAECAEHRIISFEHIFKTGIHMRLEAYHKNLSNLRPVYRNWQHLNYIFPEMLSDRLRIIFDGAISKGIEIYFKKDIGTTFTWWASYTLAYANENVVKVVNRDSELNYIKKYPGIFDQRHTLHLNINYRPNRKWQFNLAWRYNSGSPFTEFVPYEPDKPTMDEFNSSRYPPYHRLDIRLHRHFYTSKGQITAFLEVINAYNRKNVAYYNYTVHYQQDNPSVYSITKRPEHWFPFLPSVGIIWNWGD